MIKIHIIYNGLFNSIVTSLLLMININYLLFQVLDAIVVSMPHRPAVQVAVADFEKGIWKGLQIVLPGVAVRGCNFHFTQAVWRRIQKYGLAVSIHFFYTIQCINTEMILVRNKITEIN